MIARLIRSNLRPPKLLFEDSRLQLAVLEHHGQKRLVLDGDWSADIIKVAQNYDVGTLVLSRPGLDLEPILNLTQLRHLYVNCDKVDNLGSLGWMQNLTELTLLAENNTETIDFRSLTHLRRCRIYLTPERLSILSHPELRRLEVMGARAPTILDCSALRNLHWLSLLDCTRTTTLKLNSSSLIYGLWLERCPKLCDVAGAKALHSLIWLIVKLRTKITPMKLGGLRRIQYMFLLSAGNLDWLPELASATDLTWLHLVGSTRAPETHIRKLRASKSIKVLVYDKGPRSLWKQTPGVPLKAI